MQPSQSPVTHFLSDDDAKKAHQEINIVEPQFIFMPESYNGVERCTILYQGLSRFCLNIAEILTMCFKAMDYARQELNVFCSPPPFDLTSFFDCHFCLKRRSSDLTYLSAFCDFGFSILKRSLYTCFPKCMKKIKLPRQITINDTLAVPSLKVSFYCHVSA